jgi:hypothetical protein
LLSAGCGGQALDAGSNPTAGGSASAAGGSASAAGGSASAAGGSASAAGGSASAAGGSAGTQARRGKLIFTSSQRYSGNLGGLDGADKKCQALAEAAGQTGTFRAWLSTTSTSASARLTHASEPYVLVTGEVVANDWADLTSGTLRHAADQTENSQLAPPNAVSSCNPLVFWTSTDERGSQYGFDCMGWTTASVDVIATLGVNGANDRVWSTFCYGGSCNASAPILCLEQ